jgi:hypothetical protein
MSKGPKLADDTEEIAADQPPGLGVHPPARTPKALFSSDNIWFCKLPLLFTIETKTDAGMKKHTCAFVSVLEEYKGHRRPGLYILHILHIIHIYHILHILHIMILLFTGWVDACQSTIVYERSESAQVLYVVPVSSILGRLPIVSPAVGDTGTIQFQMRGESAEFLGASCDKTQGGRDRCRWWYVNSWALSDGPVMGDQAIDIAQTPQARTLSLFICKICRICIKNHMQNI